MDDKVPTPTKNDDSPLLPMAPPLPTLGGGVASGALLQQEWVGDRRNFPIVFKPGRQSLSDSISEYRTGQIMLDAEGFTVTGKAVLPAHTQTTIMVIFILLFRLGALIAYFILEYAIRRDRTDRLSWNEVSAVLVDSPENRVCIIYNLPNKPKTKYALGLKMEGGYLSEFLGGIRPHISERIIERKIGPATPPAVWIILGVVIAALIGFFVWGIVTG